MKQSKLFINFITIILILICLGISLYFRIVLPYDKIFTGDWIKFSGTDSYFFIRIVDNLLHNFPHTINFDPYMLYPSGFNIFTPPFLPILVAGTILTFTLGSPTQVAADTIAVYVPAILGALTIIPIFFICKTLFNRWAGIIAAALIAILPGEFLGRSILGFTDQHVAETLLSTTAVMFFILALNRIKKLPDIKLLWQNNKKDFSVVITYSILSGIFLGLYTITWYGALLFVLIFFIYTIVQQIINHISKESSTSLCAVSSLTFLFTLIIFLITSSNMLMILPLLMAIFVPIVLNILSIIIGRFNFKSFTFPVTIIAVGILAAICFYLINPAVFTTLVSNLSIFTWPRNTTILEMQPILFPGNTFSFIALWGNFTTSFFISLVALVIIIYQFFKKKEAGILFLVLWTLIMLAATLSMRRFAYYFVANVAILSGYISWLIIDFLVSLSAKMFSRKSNISHHAKKKDKHKRKDISTQIESKNNTSPRIIMYALGIIIVFLLVLFPNFEIAHATASGVFFAPSNAWCESLTWLKNNTPDPFDNADYYYEYYQAPSPGQVYKYPSTAYSIASWWDYGYWITRIGHRIPISNPGTNHNGEAFYFMSENPDEAGKTLTKLNSRYVIINDDMVLPNVKFHALATLSNNDVYNYVDIYYEEDKGNLSPRIYYSVKYFQTQVVRLYNFEGKKVVPTNSMVITYVEKTTPQGQPYKLITQRESFTSYEKALEYMSKLNNADKTAIVSGNPFSSPVPLEELTGYKLLHSSDIKVTPVEGIVTPEIKIFEYSKYKE